MCLNPIALNEKENACNMLLQLVRDQPLGYFEYIEPTKQIMIPLMRYAYHIRVRVAATAIIPLLMKSMILGTNKQINNNDNNPQMLEEYRKQFQSIFEELMGELLVAVLSGFNTYFWH